MMSVIGWLTNEKCPKKQFDPHPSPIIVRQRERERYRVERDIRAFIYLSLYERFRLNQNNNKTINNNSSRKIVYECVSVCVCGECRHKKNEHQHYPNATLY